MNSAIVLIVHGLWMHPTCMAHWCDRIEARGYACEMPPWPHLDAPAPMLAASPPPGLAELDVRALTDYYAAWVQAQDAPVILIGYDLGGLVVQQLLDRGLGAAGVAIAPVPPRGIALPHRVTWPIAKRRRASKEPVVLPYERFTTDIAQELPGPRQRAAYDVCVVPAPGRPFVEKSWFWASGGTKVDPEAPDRAPLLLIGGQFDRTVPEKTVRKNSRHYERSSATTTFQDFPAPSTSSPSARRVACSSPSEGRTAEM